MEHLPEDLESLATVLLVLHRLKAEKGRHHIGVLVLEKAFHILKDCDAWPMPLDVSDYLCVDTAWVA